MIILWVEMWMKNYDNVLQLTWKKVLRCDGSLNFCNISVYPDYLVTPIECARSNRRRQVTSRACHFHTYTQKNTSLHGIPQHVFFKTNLGLSILTARTQQVAIAAVRDAEH